MTLMILTVPDIQVQTGAGERNRHNSGSQPIRKSLDI